ncbi:hypothetical protein FZEAL_2143 [Fusarium zealandicum]|uniref:protein-ribulosamine 3-kinase n=1 Tax=Fusarium zealandicum TaxID=1053134 RepID=A0A8H4XN16_9HYPO|nr:hypothetical protein FZEAL_2143 [Fusarium zealandicum]
MSSQQTYPTFAAGDHEGLMEFALDQARKSPPAGNKFCVGAVLVDADTGEVLSTGFSLEYPRDYNGDVGMTHAEQCCFIKIADKHDLLEERIHEVLPANTALYTTMEPCNERLSGNMTCATRILRLQSAIKTVYVGIKEPGTFIALNDGQQRLERNGCFCAAFYNSQSQAGCTPGQRSSTFQGPTDPKEKMNYDGANGLELREGNTQVDPAVLKELPQGCKVTSTKSHGISLWARTGRIDVSLFDGTPQSFFIKVISRDRGRDMMMSEFESMNAAHNVLPEFVPKPIAWGTYTTIRDTHFFLCAFRNMKADIPRPHKFAALLSTLHQKSVSPTGKFGFHVTTYAGNLPQYIAWEDSWETFFAKSMRCALDLEIKARGPSEELNDLSRALFDEVIPRLLRPLESKGRTVKPSLIHGDLWYANSGIDVNTGEPLVFDACCFYAHNEYEFGQWRPACNRFGVEYITAYNSFVQISPPEEDFEGRLDLYRLRFDTHVSALFVDKESLRTQ